MATQLATKPRLQAGDLNTTDKQYEAAWDLLNRTRNTSNTVTIDKHTLHCLLTDHGVMWGKLNPQ